MASSVSAQYPNMDENEAAFAEFIKEKIEKAGGQIKFQHMTGHLSQLALSVRQTVGSSPRDLKKFLTKHNALFNVDSDGFVSFQKSPVVVTEKKNQNPRTDNDSDSLFPMSLKEIPGIVIKVLPSYGFIAIKQPIKTSIYFTPAVVSDNNFEIKDEKGSFLTDIPGMLPGKKVLLNAKKANTNFEAKYRATRVWTPPVVKNQVLVPEGFKPKVPKDGLYDPLSIEGSGKVQKVFEQFGFITNDNASENIFFHKSKVCNVQNIMNLAKVFAPGDSVEFKAIRSTKKDIKVRWEASKVWIKKQGKSNLFKHDSEGDAQTQKTVQPPNSPKRREMLDNLPGKIFPHTDGVVIKFGKDDTQLADADSCPFYLHGAKVQDVCWEFSDGDKINFDGIKIKSAPGFKAILAWVGVKPNIVMPVHVGDFTEFSDDENESVIENIIPEKKTKFVQPPGIKRQPKQEPYSTSTDRSRISKPSSKVSNPSSRSVSKSRSSVDKDFDLNSEDTLSTMSGETQSSGHRRRRHRRPRYDASKPVHKVNSYSSLTDDTAMDSEDSYSNQDTVEFRNSDISRDDVSSDILPETTLKPCSSFDSLDLKACLKPNPDVYKNWGDSPYLEEDNNEICSVTKEKTSLPTDTDSQFEKDIPVKNDTAKKGYSQIQIKSLKEMFPSDDEFSDAEENFKSIDSEDKTQKPVEEINDSPNVTPKDTNPSPAYEDIINLSDSEKETGTESKLSPCVKCFFDLEGKMLKVFCKYAEIEHNKLMKSMSVLWSDLYHNGVPVSDKFDDMKEVIKVGQTINFSCIEIVDDEGALWQKVTMAWKGQKPKIPDMTPQEYIKQNYLHVSVSEKDFDYGESENPFLAKVPLDITPEPVASNVTAAPRKFLSVASSDEEDESETDIPLPVEGEVTRMNIEVTPPEENELDSLDPVEEEEDLAEAVSQMISSCVDTQVSAFNFFY